MENFVPVKITVFIDQAPRNDSVPCGASVKDTKLEAKGKAVLLAVDDLPVRRDDSRVLGSQQGGGDLRT